MMTRAKHRHLRRFQGRAGKAGDGENYVVDRRPWHSVIVQRFD